MHDRVLIKRIEIEVKTAGGIILGGENEKERDTGYGKVVAVGGGKRLDSGGPVPMTVVEGDTVAFNERAPIRVTYLGEEFHTLRESDIIFIVEDKNVQEKPFEKTDSDYDKVVSKSLN